MAKRSRQWLLISIFYLLLLATGLVLLAVGLAHTVPQGRNPLLAYAPQLVTLGVLIAFVAAALLPLAWLLMHRGPRFTETKDPVDPDEIVALLRSINDRAMLSDNTRRLLGRDRDRTLLRRAIDEDVQRNDFEGAMALARELGAVYGYRSDAEELREQISNAMQQQQQQRVNEAIYGLERMLADHQWQAAEKEAAKIQRMFPNSPRVADLPHYVRRAFDQHKQSLEREFLEASRRDDVEQAMKLLKELDGYLTQEEAAPFIETARGVIGKKKENLGVQFKLAVHDKDWVSATHIGEQIVREFPNTRMADEVRRLLDALRERAARQRAATSWSAQ